MMKVLYTSLLALSLVEGSESRSVQFNPVESLLTSIVPQGQVNRTLQRDPHAPTPEQREAERQARRERNRERKLKVKEVMQKYRPETVERVSAEDLASLEEEHPSLRSLRRNNNNAVEFVDPGDDYDMWSQAYRMLGGFIDCDHQKDEGSHDNGDGGNEGGACSRWMLWASYIDPNYQGNGYYEYFGDEPVGTLDCHNPNTEWELLGVYRQEFYQYIEQISKHLWALEDYEYVVALAGLAYMTDDDCFYVGKTDDGDAIYAGVAPQPYGKFQMALYTDDYCLVPNENTGYTFDDFGLYSDVELEGGGGSQDNNGGNADYSWADEWWQDTQEYTFTQLNDVYDTFRYCTSCIDYPTYQDGYYIGDDGRDEDDLINQCWKFYSHDSFTCESDCIALAHSQGTILSVVVGDKMYGAALDSFYTDSDGSSSTSSASKASAKAVDEHPLSRLLANVFVGFSFLVFVATFLAFAVARRSRYRESRSSKSRRLLDDDDEGGRSPRSKRSSRSKSKGRDDGDGLFRGSSRKSSRSKSKTSSRSRSKNGERADEYEPPRRNSKRGSSRGRRDDF
eukprot:Nitzschia sp. Nitz4//scaffold198_size39746//12940//14717//NITZ4_007599-RA/size39746-augustus-gene-0.1-mRNA-1//1//CDS//3329540512//6116//frame0